MNKIIPVMPVSDLRNEQAKVFSQLGETPVLLTQRGRAAGILVHPDQWNEIVELLEDMEEGRLAEARWREIEEDASNARSFEAFAKELQAEGLFDG
ncbi:MAG TPA: type II toxin-antitoxin system Phd/YefM family antitoxin [Chloroflexi bacterium]|nr:type II toxin-antitoxin system Phd/YefM family antitoxin [Chloroflexota bacterium]